MVQEVRYRGWSRGAERKPYRPAPDELPITELGVPIVAPSLKELIPAEAVWTDHLAVPVAGDRVRFPSVPCRSVSIRALAANTGEVYLGCVFVNAANGFPLAAGDTLNIAIDNTERLYLGAAVNGEGVAFLVVTG